MSVSTNAAVVAAIECMATDIDKTWDSPLNWAAVTASLAELIVDIGETIEPVHLATLLGTAAMAMRQSWALNAVDLSTGGEA